ncbi:MAG TPA: hypothetical protein VE029_10550 [Rhizobacter sp.]|nr:hypothetical protein [Rhizobacter sp.]
MINDIEWVSRCADRLQHHWPHASRQAMEDCARDLLGDRRWRRLAPEVAGVVWLRLRNESVGSKQPGMSPGAGPTQSPTG